MPKRQYSVMVMLEDNPRYAGICAELEKDDSYILSCISVDTSKADDTLSLKKFDAVFLMATNILAPVKTWVRLAVEKKGLPVVVISLSPLSEKDFSTDAKLLRFCNIERNESNQSIIREINIKIRMAFNNAIAAITNAGMLNVVASGPSARGTAQPEHPKGIYINKKKIIAVGASMGGVEAVTKVLTQLPPEMPGIVVTQHMPEGFTGMYAKTLDNGCRLAVYQAEDGMEVRQGTIYIAPGGLHMRVAPSNEGGYILRVTDGEKVSGHKPSVNVLFDSVAKAAGKNAMGVILTGMGDDGATGLLKMREMGAYTVGQSADTCVVYGMPKVAYDLGAVSEQVALEQIHQRMISYARR